MWLTHLLWHHLIHLILYITCRYFSCSLWLIYQIRYSLLPLRLPLKPHGPTHARDTRLCLRPVSPTDWLLFAWSPSLLWLWCDLLAHSTSTARELYARPSPSHFCSHPLPIRSSVLKSSPVQSFTPILRQRTTTGLFISQIWGSQTETAQDQPMSVHIVVANQLQPVTNKTGPSPVQN